MKNLKKIIVLLLCVAVVFAMTACSEVANFGKFLATYDPNEQETEIEMPEETTEEPDSEGKTTGEETTEEKAAQVEKTDGSSAYISGANKDLVPEYEHYDATDFNANCEKLKGYGEDGSKDKALTLYDELYEELEYIDAMRTVIYIQSREDVNNEEYETEMEYMDELETDSADKFMIACHALSVSSFADDFKEHLEDDDMFAEYLDYEEMTEEEKELSKRETELTNEYSKVADGFEDFSYEYKGKTYKLGDFYDADSTGLSDITDAEDYYAILEGCMKQFNDAAGDIYLELVQIRTEIAKLNGYDNYADYADAEIYGRDYTSEDLETFETAVKNAGYTTGDYYSVLYYSLPELDESSIDDFIEKVEDIAVGISPYVDPAFRYFKENRLYSLGNDDSRLSAGFTASIMYPEDTNFIYCKLSESVNDLDTMIHEMGHFTEGYINGNNLIKTMSFDVAEIHSTGLEVLACSMFENAVDETTAEIMTGTVLASTRSSVVQGCIYDEWQRYVYAHPDMTLDEINSKFAEISAEYDGDTSGYVKYQWTLINHNFESPMYYISYAVSSIMSLQIWEETYESYNTAVSMWESVVDSGAYSKFTETVEKAGLKPITDTSMISQVLTDVDSVIEQVVYTTYYSGLFN